MNNKEIKGQIINSIEETNTSTLTSTFNGYINDTRGQMEKDSFIIMELLKTTTQMNERLDKLEQENKLLQEDLKETRERENKLLNRFSWLILIMNWASVIILTIVIILFINSLYPFLKGLMENDIGIKAIIITIGGAIGTGIIGIWLKFNKYVKEVIEREKKQ